MNSLTATVADAPTRQRLPQTYPAAERPRYQLLPPLVALGLSLPTGLLLYLCFFPVAWGWLAWGALIPLLLLTRSRIRPVTIYTMATVAGLVFYWPALQWMRVADEAMYFAWGFLATYCALYFPLALFFIRRLDRRTALPLAVTAPIVWTALEYLRSELGTGFSWYLLGHTQHDFLGVIQIADIAGAYGVTFLVVLVNALLAETLLLFTGLRAFVIGRAVPARYSRNAVLLQAGVAVALLLGVRGYGAYRLGQNHFTDGPRLALLQGNLDQRIRNNPSRAFDATQHYVDLCEVVVAESRKVVRGAVGGGVAWACGWSPVDLMVWPETSYPPIWTETAPGLATEACIKDAAYMAALWRTPQLLGLKADITEADGSRAEYNSALLVDDGKTIGRYDKIHLVPLGEYVPLRQTFPALRKLTPYDFDYSVASGRHHTRFPLTDKHQQCAFTFGVLICYEDTDPDVARPYSGGDGRPLVDFLLNTSNDGWFNGTSEHEQHLAICRFRAIEGRRSVARAVNMGISAVIDPNGRVLAPEELTAVQSPLHGDQPQFPIHRWGVRKSAWGKDLPVSQWNRFKKVAGVLEAAIPIDNRTSFYARVGDWLPWTCWSALAVGLFAGTVRRRLQPDQG
jgi:apolipoprotein N-acyltransferase